MKLKDFDFRIWDENHKDCGNKDCKCQSKYILGEHAKNMLSEFMGKDVEIELWTGLYDKNGKKIFEGDIVRYFGFENLVIKFINGVFMACPDYDEFLKKFEYDKNDEGVKENWLEMSYKLYRQARNGVCDRLEIIGNIHENPELLKN
ncbi:hypothetical protein B0619_07370 [Campylobacter lari]|nr:hypothetical protein [Campylobacter lari]EAK5787025.1 hypothetical protein [Campylobacter lari]